MYFKKLKYFEISEMKSKFVCEVKEKVLMLEIYSTECTGMLASVKSIPRALGKLEKITNYIQSNQKKKLEHISMKLKI